MEIRYEKAFFQIINFLIRKNWKRIWH